MSCCSTSHPVASWQLQYILWFSDKLYLLTDSVYFSPQMSPVVSSDLGHQSPRFPYQHKEPHSLQAIQLTPLQNSQPYRRAGTNNMSLYQRTLRYTCCAMLRTRLSCCSKRYQEKVASIVREIMKSLSGEFRCSSGTFESEIVQNRCATT